jgi:uncharacterized membrane protein YfcA
LTLPGLLTLAAFFAAVLSGMTGLGGGTLLIAVLYAAGLAPGVAVPLHAGVQLVSNASRTFAYLGHVDWRGCLLFMVTALPAPFLALPLVAGFDADALRLFMAGFIVLAMWPGWLAKLRLQGRAGLLLSGFIAGGVGMVTGATGLLIAPFFLREQWSKETVIATMAVCQSLAYLVKIAAFWVHGDSLLAHTPLLLPMALAVIVGTLVGRRLVNVFDEQGFRRVFRLILALLAIKLAWDGLRGMLMSA